MIEVDFPIRDPYLDDVLAFTDAGFDDPLPNRSAPDLLDITPALIAWWMTLTAGVAAALVAVLVVLGLGRIHEA